MKKIMNTLTIVALTGTALALSLGLVAILAMAASFQF